MVQRHLPVTINAESGGQVPLWATLRSATSHCALLEFALDREDLAQRAFSCIIHAAVWELQ